MAEWRSVTLGAICEEAGGGVQTGPFGSQLHAADYVADGVPSVMPQNIGENRIISDGIARVSPRDMQRLQKYWLRAGDIVYSRRGDVERRALVREENDGWLCGTGCLRVRIEDQSVHDPRFVSYALGLAETKAWIVRHAVGATMLNLNTSILSAVPLRVTEIGDQRAIAEVLGALDDKIAANDRELRLIDELCAARVAEAVAASDVSVQLKNILTLHYGKALPAAHRRPGEVTVFGSGGVAGSHDQSLVASPGVVVGRKGTAGAVHWADGPHYPIDTTYFVEARGAIKSEVLYYLLRRLPLAELNSDSAVPGLNRDEAYAQWTGVPSLEDSQLLGEELASRFALAGAVRTESQRLAQTRDQLLPLLMSGRVRVRNAAQVVEGVA